MVKRFIVACVIAWPAVLLAQSVPASVDSLGWMSGCWVMDSGSRQAAEHWMAPAGGTLLGMSRTVSGGRTVAYEFMQIRQQDDGIFFVAWPSGQSEAAFRLVRIGPQEVVFENAEHDFPQRILYRSEDGGRLVARIEGLRDGEVRGVDFPMTRTPCP